MAIAVKSFAGEYGSDLKRNGLAAIGLLPELKRVWPSGLAWATSRAASMPLPPGRFSTVKGCLNAAPSACATSRVAISWRLPTGVLATMMTGADGHADTGD